MLISNSLLLICRSAIDKKSYLIEDGDVMFVITLRVSEKQGW